MDDRGLYPIYGMWHKPFWQTKLFYFIVAAFFALILFLILFFLIKKCIARKRKKSAWEIALLELERIKMLLLQNKISAEGFYVSLTSVLKNYFHGRYGYDIFGKTDEELVAFLENKKFDSLLLENMKSMFGSLKFVKFAKKEAAKEVMEKDLKICLDIVQKTIPKEIDKK